MVSKEKRRGYELGLSFPTKFKLILIAMSTCVARSILKFPFLNSINIVFQSPCITPNISSRFQTSHALGGGRRAVVALTGGLICCFVNFSICNWCNPISVYSTCFKPFCVVRTPVCRAVTVLQSTNSERCNPLKIQLLAGDLGVSMKWWSYFHGNLRDNGG